jgi:hypothetical protein
LKKERSVVSFPKYRILLEPKNKQLDKAEEHAIIISTAEGLIDVNLDLDLNWEFSVRSSLRELHFIRKDPSWGLQEGNSFTPPDSTLSDPSISLPGCPDTGIVGGIDNEMTNIPPIYDLHQLNFL